MRHDRFEADGWRLVGFGDHRSSNRCGRGERLGFCCHSGLRGQTQQQGGKQDDGCDVFREHNLAGCGMLVAGGFCYRMLLDES